MGLQHCCYHPTRRQEMHRCHRTQDQAFTGSPRSKSSPWAPLRPPTPRTAVLSTKNSSTSTFPLICRDATPNAASPSFDASPAGTLTTPMTYQSTYRLASPPTSLTPRRPNPNLTTSPSTTSHHRLNASRSNRFRDTNSFAAVVASLRYSTKLIGLGYSAPPGNARWTYKTSDPTFFGTGRAHQYNTARPTAYTARCASVQPAANYRGLGAKSSSPRVTASSRVLFGSNTSAFPPFLPGLTFGTRPATASGGWAR